jgi:hypothetical protein
MDPNLNNLSEAQANAILNNSPMPPPASGAAADNTGAAGANPNPAGAANPNQNGAAASSAAPNTGAAASQTPPANAAAAASAPPAGAGTAEPFDLTKWLGGRYKSIQDLEKDVTQLPALQQQLNEAQRPKHSERVQKVIDFAAMYEGMEPEAAQRYLSLQRIDVKSLPDQQARFEAFKLDPRYGRLTDDKQAKLFRELEIEQFGDPSNAEKPQSETQLIRQELATQEAKDKISKLQSEYVTAKGAQLSPEEEAAERQSLRTLVQQELATFAGIPFKFSVLDGEGKTVEGAMNYKIDPEKQLKVLMDAATDPLGWWDSILERRGVFTAASDQPNRQKFAQILSRLEFQDDIDNQIYQQGRNDMLAEYVRTHRNPADNTNGGGSGGAGNANPDTRSHQEKVAEKVANSLGLS